MQCLINYDRFNIPYDHYASQETKHYQHFRTSNGTPPISSIILVPRGNPYSDFYHHRLVLLVSEFGISMELYNVYSFVVLSLFLFFFYNKTPLYLIILVVYNICSFGLLYTLTLNDCTTTYPVNCWWALSFFLFVVLTKNAAMNLFIPVFWSTDSFIL